MFLCVSERSLLKKGPKFAPTPNQLPHKNIVADERKALQDLKKDETRILMKADKGNCFVVLDKCDSVNGLFT